MQFGEHRDTIWIWALALLGTLALMETAQADGMPEDRPIGAVPVYVTPSWSAPWTGFYIGAHGGYAHTDVQFSSLTGIDVVSDGGVVGGHAGYNWQIHRFVLGIEGDGTGIWIDSRDGSCVRPFNCLTHYNWLASLRGRVGIVLDDKITLIYATAGVAWTDVDYTVTTGALVGRGFSEQDTGWVAGAGIEHVLRQHLTWRIEYLFYEFGDTTAPAGALGPIPTTLTPNAQVGRLGISFKY